jgi:long-chain fatty acid transport protein
MKKKILSLFTVCVALGAHAGGFKTALQGQKQIGMASCGTGLALDASSVYFNPGALAYSPNQIVFGVTGLMPRTQFLDASTQTVTNAVAKTFTPFALYGSYGINKKLVAGLGVYTPFGSGIAYPAGWTGAYALTEITLQSIFIKPTLSYKVSNEFSIGAGVAFATGSVNLEKDVPVQGQLYPNVGHAKLNGSAAGTTFDVGAYYAKNKLSAGLVYRHIMNMKVAEGKNTFTNIPAAAATSFPDGTFTSSLPLPGEISFGLGYKATNKLLLAFDVNYTLWNSYDSLKFDFATNTSKLADVADPRLYENAAAIRLGAQYTVNNKLAVRGGVFYDMTPVKDGYVTPESPDNNRVGASVGASYRVGRNVTIDASLMYQDVPARLQQNLVTGLNGTFATKVLAPGIGISYNFKNPKPKPVVTPPVAPSNN